MTDIQQRMDPPLRLDPDTPSLVQRSWTWFARYRVQLLGIVLGAVLWEIAGQIGVSPALPPISAVLAAGAELWSSERFLDSAYTTATSILIALPPSLIVGVVLGLLMGLFRPVEWIVRPYVNASLSLPLVAIIPIILLDRKSTRLNSSHSSPSRMPSSA